MRKLLDVATAAAVAFAVLAGCNGGGDSKEAATHVLGGTVSGLTGTGLALQSGAGEDLAVSANGPFAFPARIAEGTAYAVAVVTQPSGQTCSVANGSGTMGAADVTNVVVTCTAVIPRYTVGGAVTGLTGTGLVLQNSGGDDLAVQGNGPFTFATTVASGSPYTVTVKSQPTSQTCAVANEAGTIGASAVTNVAVTCTNVPPNSFTVGGSISGLDTGKSVVLRNAGINTTVGSNGAYTLSAPVARGAGYAVTIATQPVAQTCTVANPAGTMGSAPVTNVNVTCTTNAYTVGGTVTALVGSGLVLRSDAGAGEDLPVAKNATTFAFTQKAISGSTVNITVKTQPTAPAERCTVSGSPVTIGSSDVASVTVSCTTAIQAWAAPTTWGARWTETQTMLQHAYFNGTTIVESKGVQWALKGTPAPSQRSLEAFTAGPRWGAGPFGAARYEATSGDGALDLSGNMLVCAVVKPDYNPVTEGKDPVIIAKGFDQNQPGLKSGWVLIQRHHMFNFQYQYADGLGNGFTRMGYAPTYFADESLRGNGPLNPSYMVVCAGRDGDDIRLAVNGYDGVLFSETIPVAGAPLFVASPPAPLTIGGYSNGDPDHGYGGRIYETAIWAEAATPANIQTKIAAVLGVEGGARYLRNREAPFIGPDGKLHTAGRSAPRFYAPNGSFGGGLLFGLQGWNRLTQQYDAVAAGDPPQQNPVIALGEDLANARWTKSAAAVTTARQMEPPGDSERPTAARVLLPPGESLSTALGTFDSAGPIHAMMWIRPVSASGTLRVATGATSRHDVNLSTLPAGQWTRVWLSGLTTTASGTETLTLSNPANPSGSAIEFYAWGLDLTQIGRGADLGAFDPGPVMYDWGGDYAGAFGDGASALDVLELPTVPASTDATGFCMTVDAQPPAGLPWNAIFKADRALLTWVADAGNGSVNLFFGGASNTSVTAGDLCAYISTLDTSICWTPTWAPGSKHTVGVCSTATGDLTLYGDGAPVGTPITSTTKPPDLGGGHVLVGNNRTAGSPSATWQGFISRAAVCPAADVTACR